MQQFVNGNNSQSWQEFLWPSSLGSVPDASAKVKSLGVFLDSHLAMEPQIKSVSVACFFFLEF